MYFLHKTHPVVPPSFVREERNFVPQSAAVAGEAAVNLRIVFWDRIYSF